MRVWECGWVWVWVWSIEWGEGWPGDVRCTACMFPHTPSERNQQLCGCCKCVTCVVLGCPVGAHSTPCTGVPLDLGPRSYPPASVRICSCPSPCPSPIPGLSLSRELHLLDLVLHRGAARVRAAVLPRLLRRWVRIGMEAVQECARSAGELPCSKRCGWDTHEGSYFCVIQRPA